MRWSKRPRVRGCGEGRVDVPFLPTARDGALLASKPRGSGPAIYGPAIAGLAISHICMVKPPPHRACQYRSGPRTGARRRLRLHGSRASRAGPVAPTGRPAPSGRSGGFSGRRGSTRRLPLRPAQKTLAKEPGQGAGRPAYKPAAAEAPSGFRPSSETRGSQGRRGRRRPSSTSRRQRGALMASQRGWSSLMSSPVWECPP